MSIKNKYMEEKNNEKEIVCSECFTTNHGNDYCIECGHKLRKIKKEKHNKKYCLQCGTMVDHDDKYCPDCGHEIKVSDKFRVCSVCGEKISIYDNFCINCGHKMKNSPMIVAGRGGIFEMLFREDNDITQKKHNYPKKCPGCGHKHQMFFNYCDICGTKLETKKKKVKFTLF